MTMKTSKFLRIGLPLVLTGAVGLALAQTERGRALIASATTGEGGASAPKTTGAAAPPASTPGRRQGGGPAVPVTIMEVKPHSVPVTFSAIGTVQPMAAVALKSRIDSQVVSVSVEEGALVKTGDLLVTLDDRTLKAQLAQIEAQVAKDDAQIAQAERDVLRFEELLDRKIGTQVQKDTAMTTLKSLKAQKAADEAQALNIRTQLGFTELRAPISGRIGSIAAKPGAIVRAADVTAIANINQIDPIYITVSIPQAMLPELKESMAKGTVAVTAMAGATRATGTIAFIENGVDAATGTVAIKAKMNNPAETLWPGAFVRATMTLSDDPAALTVPLVALQNGQAGPYVFLADANGTAKQTPVTVSRTIGEEVVITAGIKAGDKVITSGQLRLINGTAIQVPGAGGAPGRQQQPSASGEAPKRG